MTMTLVRNVSNGPVPLPLPFFGLLPPGRAVILDETLADVLELFGGAEAVERTIALDVIPAEAETAGVRYLGSLADDTVTDALSLTTNGNGASMIGVEDSAGKITGTNVETALAELALAKSKLALTTTGNGLSLLGLEDAAGLFTAANGEAAFLELAKYVPILLADPGGANAAIPVTRSATVPIVTAGAETNTLAVPSFVGQKLILTCRTHAVGDRVVTASAAINVANNTHMTFSADSQTIELVAVYATGGTLVWAVGFNDGVTLS